MSLKDNFETLWTSYPSDLCRKKRGSKLLAKKAFDKINPSDDEFKRIMMNMRAQIKSDRMDKDAYRWPFVSSYLNQARYDDYIEPTREIKSEELKRCNHDSCMGLVIGSAFTMCSRHVPCQHDDRLKEAWKKTGLNRQSATLAQDCRAYCKDKGYLI